MRLSLAAVVATGSALSLGAAATAAPPALLKPSAPVIEIADTAAPGGLTMTKPDGAPPAAPVGDSGGKIEIKPPPAPPPNLNVPPAPVPPPNQRGFEGNPPPNESFEPHQEPAPRGQTPDELPRGEGAAALPREKPSGIKAIEDWVWSWFE